jgi:hypothetical protein
VKSGTDGNELLTISTAVVLVVLLLAEGVTVIQMHGLRTVHMFIGLLLIPPVLLKIGSTGYRFVRYYTHARAYVVKGPPLLPLRLLAPVLVLTTVGMFATGVLLMAAGHKSDSLLLLHKVFFIVWGVLFGIHFLAYLPRVIRSLRSRVPIGGAGIRRALVGASVAGGLVLAIALLSTMDHWHR